MGDDPILQLMQKGSVVGTAFVSFHMPAWLAARSDYVVDFVIRLIFTGMNGFEIVRNGEVFDDVGVVWRETWRMLAK